MELHAEAMFTHDRNMRLLTINEPWPGEPPAPRFFLGRTIDGSALCRCRHDVPEKLAAQLKELCADEPHIRDVRTKPRHMEAYMSLLHSQRFTMGPCYLVPDAAPAMEVVRITRENSTELLHGGFEWLTTEIDYAQPCIALVRDNRAVSICRRELMKRGWRPWIPIVEGVMLAPWLPAGHGPCGRWKRSRYTARWKRICHPNAWHKN